ncbi:MAG: 6-bladed beta-propeller [Bacteroidales bacterium]
MKQKILLSILIVLPIISCRNQVVQGGGTIEYAGVCEPAKVFYEKIKTIKLIPLETKDSALLGGKVELEVTPDYFFLVDMSAKKQVLKFTRDGKYILPIGMIGNGPGEYIEIISANICEDSVYIFAPPAATVNVYDLNGHFGKTYMFEDYASQAYRLPGVFINYIGYGKDMPYRLITHRDGNNAEFLTHTSQIISLDDNTPNFYKISDDRLIIRELFGNQIYEYNRADQQVNPYITFDFGELALPQEFYQMQFMESGEYLMKNNFMAIKRYLESNKDGLKIAEFDLNLPKEGKIQKIYWIDDDNRGGRWFSLSEKSLFYNSFRLFDHDKLYCLISPAKLKGMSNEEKRLFSSVCKNNDVMESAKELDNYLIAEIQL